MIREFINSLKIKGKLLTAFGVVLLLSTILAVWGYFSINRIMAIRSVEATFNGINNTSLKMRKSEKDFLMREGKNEEFMKTGKSKYIGEMDRYSKLQDSLISTLLDSKWSEKLQIATDLTVLKASIAEYRSTFDKITKAYQARGFKDYGDEGELRQAIHAIENSEYKFDMVQMLTLRRIEKDYFLRRDPEYVKKFETEVNDFKAMEDRTTPAGKAIISKLAIYQDKFNDIVKTDELIGLNENSGLLGEMRASIHKIEPILLKLEDNVEQRSQDLASSTIMTFAIVFVIELLLGIALAIRFSGYMTSNIKTVQEAAVKLSKGIIPETLEVKTRDELGDTQGSVNDLIRSLKDSVEVANFVARGNLFSAQQAAKNRLKDGELDTAIKNMIKKLGETVMDITRGSEEISYGSIEISKSSQVVAQGATEQASSIEEISSSVEQMVSNVNQNADNAQQAEAISRDASEKMKKVRDAAGTTFMSIKTITEKIEIINEIADKTNLLAINAAVEAARAGEHGKGFAVVANEVRKLAERSQQSAVQIIELSNSTIREAEYSGNLLDELAPDVQKSFNLVREISSSSAEQRAGAEQINTALAQLNQVTQQNASSAEELASASKNFNAQAAKLKETVSFFKLLKRDEVTYQRDRIIGQIEHLRAILNETDNGSDAGVIPEVAPTNYKAAAPVNVKSLEDFGGGPSIILDDFDSPPDDFSIEFGKDDKEKAS